MKTLRKLRRMFGYLTTRFKELHTAPIVDTRSKQGRRWELAPVTDTALLGLMAGCTGTADVEKLTQDLPKPMRDMLDIGKRLPDTTLRDILCRQHPNEMRKLLHTSVKYAERRKALTNADKKFPFKVVSMDGKAITIKCWDDTYGQRHLHKKTQTVFGLLRTITSCLVTAAGRPCLDAVPVPYDTNEMGVFPHAFSELNRIHGGLFDVITYDAGVTSLENADLVIEAGKHYLFRLKDKRRQMYKLAEMMLADKTEPDAISEDVLTNDTVVIRKVFLSSVKSTRPPRKSVARSFWEHTKTFVRIRSEKYVSGKLTEQEERYYNTSIEVSGLLSHQWLELIRMHWGVETCHNILDVAFLEDKHPWINGDVTGALVVQILRRVAYNLLTWFRSVTLRSEENRSMPWKSLKVWVYNTSIAVTNDVVAGIRKRTVATTAI